MQEQSISELQEKMTSGELTARRLTELFLEQIDLIDLDTKQSVGRISEDDLSWLGERLEKESVDDRDYYFDPATIDMLEGEGASADLLALLRRVLGDREGMELRWAPLP